jgi:hypothetical protein
LAEILIMPSNDELLEVLQSRYAREEMRWKNTFQWARTDRGIKLRFAVLIDPVEEDSFTLLCASNTQELTEAVEDELLILRNRRYMHKKRG